MRFVNRIFFQILISCAFILSDRVFAQGLDSIFVYDTEFSNSVTLHMMPNKVDLMGLGISSVPLFTSIQRKSFIKNFIKNDLKSILISFLLSKEWSALKESSGLKWIELEKMEMDRFLKDIEDSPYEIKRSCKDGVRAKEGASGWSFGQAVCFSPSKILNTEEGWNEVEMRAKITALALHEHLHHFGVIDADNRIYKQFFFKVLTRLTETLPDPLEVKVTHNFKKFRNDFQVSEDLNEDLIFKDGGQWNCELESRAAEGISSVLIQEVITWAHSGIRIENSRINPERFTLFSEHPTAPTELSVPIFLFKFGRGDLTTWQLSSAHPTVEVNARMLSDSRIILEFSKNIALQDEHLSLPSVIYGVRSDAFCYAECEIRH